MKKTYGEVKEFIEKITNQTILDVKRRGKYLVFVLEDYNLISHLKMEGKYFIKDKYEITKHDHVIFTLDNNKYLIYNDTRKFGKMYLINKEYDNNLDTALSILYGDVNILHTIDLYRNVKIERK